MKVMRPHLAITIGDPAGIGPEVVLKALGDRQLSADCHLTVIGSQAVLQATYEQLEAKGIVAANPQDLDIWDVPSHEIITAGIGNAVTGDLSFRYLTKAIASTLNGQFQGIVTGPIAKYHWQSAGHDYPGQTELLAEKAKVDQYGMFFVAQSPHSNFVWKTLLATTHIPLSAVPKTLTPDLLTNKLELLINCLQQDFGITHPRIAIAGINPHSGENGALGAEEKNWLIPWLQQAGDRYSQITLEGPIPPDTMWIKPGQAWQGNIPPAHDAYLAMYHDQGLIPVKLMAFDLAVNTTIGLPFIRTSPDHGTAFDIAGRGVANATSMQAAIKLASQLAHQRFIKV
jgi:4-hydroxythreonine-4-phosphate dehydrogenase